MHRRPFEGRHLVLLAAVIYLEELVVYIDMCLLPGSIYVYPKSKLDVDPRRDDDASPMSSYRCMSSSQVKIRISNFFGKIHFLGFHVVVLVKTFPLMYQLLM